MYKIGLSNQHKISKKINSNFIKYLIEMLVILWSNRFVTQNEKDCDDGLVFVHVSYIVIYKFDFEELLLHIEYKCI